MSNLVIYKYICSEIHKNKTVDQPDLGTCTTDTFTCKNLRLSNGVVFSLKRRLEQPRKKIAQITFITRLLRLLKNVKRLL